MDREGGSGDIINDIWQLEFKIKTLKRQQKFFEAERYEYELEMLLKSQSSNPDGSSINPDVKT